MKLNNLLNILRSGNMALNQKLQNLLTEDCVILEYTDDAVLFHKNNHLVLAKFKHNLSESRMSADDILDNDVIYVSNSEVQKDLKHSILSIVDHIVEDNYVLAEEELKTFCEQYYQYSLLKQHYPVIFQEHLKKQSKGLAIRKKAKEQLQEFRSDLFRLASASLDVDGSFDADDYISVLENTGLVLALGKKKLLPIVEDALLGNVPLADTVLSRLYETASSLTEANEDLMGLVSSKYDLESGKYADEDEEEVDQEDLDADIDSDYPEEEVGEEEGPSEFKEFDPSKLSDEEIKTLHIDILKSFLHAMEEFVSREVNDPENTAIDPDLDDKLREDLDKLDDVAISDEDLSKIEADWEPVLNFFLSSDLYKSEQDIEEEVPLEAELGAEELPEEEEELSEELPEEGLEELPEEGGLEELPEEGLEFEEELPEEEEELPATQAKPKLKV